MEREGLPRGMCGREVTRGEIYLLGTERGFTRQIDLS